MNLQIKLLKFPIKAYFYHLDLCYLNNAVLNSHQLTGQFSIQQGPEWDWMVNHEKKNAQLGGFFDKVKNVDFFPTGNIIISWGGPFKKTKSISMIYSNEGAFLKRIFRNEALQFKPTHISIENDSTLWLYHSGAYLLTRTYLKNYKSALE